MDAHESYIHGHHILKHFCTPVFNEELFCDQEKRNPHDLFAVAVKKENLVFGHAPRKHSAVVTKWNNTATVWNRHSNSMTCLRVALKVTA